MGNRNTERTNRLLDLEFIEAVRAASLDELFEWRRRLAPSSAPEWKRIAVQRQIARLLDSAGQPAHTGNAMKPHT